MKDYLGKELKVGDDVIYIAMGNREYCKGRITRFTKCFVFFDYILSDGSISQFGLKQTPEQLIKL